MIHQYRFLSVCEQELAESIDFYDEISFELGREFFRNFGSTIERLLFSPGIGVTVGDGLRSFHIRKFPFNIIYRIETDEIIIVCGRTPKSLPSVLEGKALGYDRHFE